MNYNFRFFRNNGTKLGLITLGCVLVAVTIFSLQYFMDRLFVREAYAIGMRSAESVEINIQNLYKIFARKIDRKTEMRILDLLSVTGQIYKYEFINPNGIVVYQTGSYHAPSDHNRAHYHGHVHAQKMGGGEALVPATTDRPNERVVSEKMMAGEALSSGNMMVGNLQIRSAPENHHNLSHHPNSQHNVHLLNGNGVTEPLVYASVNHPILKNGILQGRIRVSVDQTELHALFNDTILWLSVILLVVTALGLGVPSLFYIRGKEKEEVAIRKVDFLVHHDEMTQLVNRKKFIEMVDALLNDEENTNTGYALYTIDIDRLKSFNDMYGHEAGDDLLRKISEHLRHSLSSKHIISRLGGDEFAILQKDANSKKSVEEFANHIMMVFSGLYQTSDLKVSTSASIGVVLCDQNSTACLDLLRRADIALSIVKNTGRAGYLIFEPSMKQQLDKRKKLEDTIRQASRDGLFEVYYQPQFTGSDTQLCGFEALIRMKDDDGNYISPAVFIPVAEEIGLIGEIGLWVLKTAAKTAFKWPDTLFVAVNLSSIQFENGELVDEIENTLKESGLPANRLELEITEGLIMKNTEWNLIQLHALKNLGVSVAMDDFGTGFSSLSYLWRFPFDKIKIDQAFLREAGENNNNVGKVIQTIISLGHSLNMKVTTEGVETAEQLKMLMDFNCDYLQGFHLGRPCPEDHIAPLLLKSVLRKLNPDEQPSSGSRVDNVISELTRAG